MKLDMATEERLGTLQGKIEGLFGKVENLTGEDGREKGEMREVMKEFGGEIGWRRGMEGRLRKVERWLLV